MSLLSLIPEALVAPTWLVFTQGEVELHWRMKLDQKEDAGTSMS